MRPCALITGAGRKNSIGYATALKLATDGWDLAVNYLRRYDDRLGLPRDEEDLNELVGRCEELGARVRLLETDLECSSAPKDLITWAGESGDLRALVLAHCESVDSGVLSTTVESWDRHYAVNVRANWLLIKEFAEMADQDPNSIKSVVALTSDHTAHNLPYGSSKGALDRLVMAAGVELGERGFRCNVINPGPIDTGWMPPGLAEKLRESTPAGRLGTPQDTANLIGFLLSDEGQWINAQLLQSNGGFGAK